MHKQSVPRRGVSACPQTPDSAVIRSLTYNAVGSFARFVERVEFCSPPEARLAAEFAFALSNFLCWQRLAAGDHDEATRFIGRTPENLATLQAELRRVANLAQGKAKAHKANQQAGLGQSDAPPAVNEEAEFWRAIAEGYAKGGVQ